MKMSDPSKPNFEALGSVLPQNQYKNLLIYFSQLATMELLKQYFVFRKLCTLGEHFSRDILGIRFTIKQKKLSKYIYSAQLRHHQENTYSIGQYALVVRKIYIDSFFCFIVKCTK